MNLPATYTSTRGFRVHVLRVGRGPNFHHVKVEAYLNGGCEPADVLLVGKVCQDGSHTLRFPNQLRFLDSGGFEGIADIVQAVIWCAHRELGDAVVYEVDAQNDAEATEAWGFTNLPPRRN